MARDTIPGIEPETPDLECDHGYDPVANRRAWLAALRQQGDRQCTGAYASGDGRLVCALGLLREVVLPTWSDVERDTIDEVETVGELAGLSERQSFDVTHMNDGEYIFPKYTFAEIADVVEGWFK